MISQAEHGATAWLTDNNSETLAETVEENLAKLAASAERSEKI